LCARIGGVTSKAGYWIGGGLIVCAIAGAILWAVIGITNLISTIDDFHHVAIPGSEVERLEAPKYGIYIEGPGADESAPPVRIRVTDARTEAPVPVRDYGATVTYSFDRTGSALATVTPPHAGDYRVRTEGEGSSDYRLAIGDSVGGKIVSAVVGAFVVGGVLGISGIALIIIAAVKRSRRRRQQPPPGSGLPGLGV